MVMHEFSFLELCTVLRCIIFVELAATNKNDKVLIVSWNFKKSSRSKLSAAVSVRFRRLAYK